MPRAAFVEHFVPLSEPQNGIPSLMMDTTPHYAIDVAIDDW